MRLAFAKYNSTLCRVCVKSARLSWALCFWYHIVLVNITLMAQWPQHTLHFVWAWLLKSFSPVFTEGPFPVKNHWLENATMKYKLAKVRDFYRALNRMSVFLISMWPVCHSGNRCVLFKHPSASWLMAEIHFKADFCVTRNLKLYLQAVFFCFKCTDRRRHRWHHQPGIEFKRWIYDTDRLGFAASQHGM